MAEIKYHINAQTQRPNICRAGVRNCPVGGQHFDSKEKAQAYVEDVNSATYGVAPSSMKKTKKRAAEVLDRSTKIRATLNRFQDKGDEFNNGSSSSGYANNIVEDVTGVYPIKTLEQPDYYNSSLIEVDGEHYVVRTKAGVWSDDEYMYATHVEQKTVPVLATTVTPFESGTALDDERISLIKEAIDNGNGFSILEDNGNLEINPYLSHADEKRNIVREDGSTLHVVQLESEGGQQFTDTPHPFQADVTLEENGEKQNSRTMDEGWAIYDTRSRKGVVLIHRTGSEGGYGDAWDLSKDGNLSATDFGQRAYLLDGDGSTADSVYYESSGTLNEWA